MDPVSVICEKIKGKNGSLGVLLLNRPQVLNALNLEMCKASLETLHLWKTDPEIKCVFIHGNGERGFCAGGDVKFLREQNLKDLGSDITPKYALDFFAYEYANDLFISQFPKPVVAWGSGITMGGGIGVFQGASHRVCTESSLFAMPEIHIGFFPDVGGSVFLNRLPPGVGLFLGMTAARFSAHDALEIGLSDFFIQDALKGKVIDDLIRINWSLEANNNHLLVADMLNQRRTNLEFPAPIVKALDLLAPLEHSATPQQAYGLIEELTKRNNWILESYENSRSGSPLSLAIAFEQIKRGKSLSLLEGFKMEYQMALNLCLNSDFMEGVRTRLVDKQDKPKWRFGSLKSINQESVQAYFQDPFENQLKSSENHLEKLLEKYA
jgi:enoyl-CoA hydratase/carnithine racemase